MSINLRSTITIARAILLIDESASDNQTIIIRQLGSNNYYQTSRAKVHKLKTVMRLKQGYTQINKTKFNYFLGSSCSSNKPLVAKLL